jgi:hypothetical protein
LLWATLLKNCLVLFFTWVLIRISFWKCDILRIQYQTCGS